MSTIGIQYIGTLKGINKAKSEIKEKHLQTMTVM